MRKTLFFACLATLFVMISCGRNPEKSRLYLDKGIDYLYSSQFDEAIGFLDKAIQYDANNYEAYYYRGCAYRNNFKEDKAFLDWSKAIEIKPDYPDPYFNIGLMYRRNNDYKMACYYFKLAKQYGRPNIDDYLKNCEYYE